MKPSQKTGQTKPGVPKADGILVFNDLGFVMSDPTRHLQPAGPFCDEDRAAVYRAIFSRRDVRSQFTQAPVEAPLWQRLLMAARHAPSLCFMQPWNFVVIRNPAVKAEVQDAFYRANVEALAMFADDRKLLHSALKLQGITEAPVNLCITGDRARRRGCSGAHAQPRHGPLFHSLRSAKSVAGSTGRRFGAGLGQQLC